MRGDIYVEESGWREWGGEEKTLGTKVGLAGVHWVHYRLGGAWRPGLAGSL